jgi:phosphonate transport system ATP-binding protein
MKILLENCTGCHPAARVNAPAALRGLNLTVASGEQLAVIGPSGAGKTTLLHLLACALKPVSGTLQLDGRNPWQLSRTALQRLRGELFLAPQVPPLPTARGHRRAGRAAAARESVGQRAQPVLPD